MNSLMIFLAAAALGIEVGWEPLDGGGHEYTIQFEPQMIEILKRGNDEIFSEVPPEVNVRRFRFLIGEGKLARVTDRPGKTQPPALPPAQVSDDDVRRPRIPFDEADTAARSSDGKEADSTEAPARLDKSVAAPSGLQRATHDEPPETVRADKLMTPPDAAPGEPGRPWFAFVTAMVLLCCSLGANVYLAWAAWQARSRYRATVAKLRAAPAS